MYVCRQKKKKKRKKKKSEYELYLRCYLSQVLQYELYLRCYLSQVLQYELFFEVLSVSSVPIYAQCHVTPTLINFCF
jgi:hypothetical protein